MGNHQFCWRPAWMKMQLSHLADRPNSYSRWSMQAPHPSPAAVSPAACERWTCGTASTWASSTGAGGSARRSPGRLHGAAGVRIDL